MKLVAVVATWPCYSLLLELTTEEALHWVAVGDHKVRRIATIRKRWGFYDCKYKHHSKVMSHAVCREIFPTLS